MAVGTLTVTQTADYGTAKEYQIAGEFYIVGLSSRADDEYEVMAGVGTVMRMICDQFPPDEIMSLFPGFVAARVDDSGLFEYGPGDRAVRAVGDRLEAVAEIPAEYLDCE